MNIQAFSTAVFDLDGTLLNTLRDISEAANRTLCHAGFDPHPESSFRHFIGDGPEVLFQRAIGAETIKDPRISELVNQYKEECILQEDRHTTLYPGISGLLDLLQHSGISLTILTNKRQPHADTCVARFLNRWPWQIVLGSGDHIPKKPDPQGALQIATTLNVSPAACLYFGDTDVDMLTAKSAGMTAIGVLWGFRDQQELESAGANSIISHPLEIEPIQ